MEGTYSTLLIQDCIFDSIIADTIVNITGEYPLIVISDSTFSNNTVSYFVYLSGYSEKIEPSPVGMYYKVLSHICTDATTFEAGSTFVSITYYCIGNQQDI
jgi:hypothetical protein